MKLKTKYLTFIILILLIVSSCKEQGNLEKENTNLKEKITDTLSDPTEFIGKHKPKATVLGVFHFNNPGLDDYKPKFSVDIFSSKRQAELTELIKNLAEYNPTKILVEVARKESDSLLNDRYTNYLNGTFDISDKASETYQLGFRLAKRLEHDRIYASDAKGSKWFGADIDWDNYDSEEYQKSLNQYEKTHRYDYEKMYEYHDSLKTVQTLTEHFKHINNPSNRLKDHQGYLTETLLTGAGDLYIGADAVARWYQRNLKIFANTYDIVEFDKEERILLIYGSGHVWQLRQLLTDSPDYEYVEINEYLSE